MQHAARSPSRTDPRWNACVRARALGSGWSKDAARLNACSSSSSRCNVWEAAGQLEARAHPTWDGCRCHNRHVIAHGQSYLIAIR